MPFIWRRNKSKAIKATTEEGLVDTSVLITSSTVLVSVEFLGATRCYTLAVLRATLAALAALRA